MKIRLAKTADSAAMLAIYNMGIEDRIATLESSVKDAVYMNEWMEAHQGRYAVLVAEVEDQIVGWASLNPYSHRCAYSGVADLSVYISRSHRGKGIGTALLKELDEVARSHQFYKIVLFTFPHNEPGQSLYHKAGYRKVGIFEKQGILDGQYIDIMAMEKLL
ncbi:arsinothricin resistance N-acetyltransferase ArsN1 family A [Paenibacillus mesotrionivorans]|uniref:Arsinothricin resistance N-acetyltransferase ArsN1 family A n=1 Tax=Paenibacillus mesotrionivorans TaxID=3160968 RepID=A0ACC7NWF5_9BACL